MQPESELEANAAFEQDFGGEPAAFNEFGASEGLLPAAQEGLHPVAQEGLHPVAQVGAPPVAQKGAPPAEEFEAIDPEFAHKLLRNETWSRPLTGSKRNKRHPLPTIAPSMVERVVELLARLRGLLNKRLPGQPELVKQGERLALDYLTRGKGAACASTSPFESWAEVHVGIFNVDNWAPRTNNIMVQNEAHAGPALKRVREQGPNPNLNKFVGKDGLLHYTAAAGEGGLMEVTGGAKVTIVNVNTRSQYTPKKDTVGYGITAPSNDECNMDMVSATLAAVLNDVEVLLGWCSSSIAREDVLEWLEDQKAHALVLDTPALQELGRVTSHETSANRQHCLALIWLPGKPGVRSEGRMRFVQFRQSLSKDAIHGQIAGCTLRNRQAQSFRRLLGLPAGHIHARSSLPSVEAARRSVEAARRAAEPRKILHRRARSIGRCERRGSMGACPCCQRRVYRAFLPVRRHPTRLLPRCRIRARRRHHRVYRAFLPVRRRPTRLLPRCRLRARRRRHRHHHRCLAPLSLPRCSTRRLPRRRRPVRRRPARLL